jgi:antitoxin VapB
VPEAGVARIFRNGRSQAVRIPQEFRFRGDRVRIRKMGRGVLLEPILEVQEWFAELDRIDDEEFMLGGRDQPDTPIRKVFD